jgi:hypothetical protein
MEAGYKESALVALPSRHPSSPPPLSSCCSTSTSRALPTAAPRASVFHWSKRTASTTLPASDDDIFYRGSVKRFFSQDEITDLFAPPLSQVAYDQDLNIQQRMETTVLIRWAYQ